MSTPEPWGRAVPPLVLRWGVVGGACVYGRTAREKGAGEGPAPVVGKIGKFRVRRDDGGSAGTPCTTQKDSTGDAVGWSWMTPMEAPQKMVFFILGLLVPRLPRSPPTRSDVFL